MKNISVLAVMLLLAAAPAAKCAFISGSNETEDNLVGTAEDDILRAASSNANTNNDTLTGGAGSDLFMLGVPRTGNFYGITGAGSNATPNFYITDFEIGKDKLLLPVEQPNIVVMEIGTGSESWQIDAYEGGVFGELIYFCTIALVNGHFEVSIYRTTDGGWFYMGRINIASGFNFRDIFENALFVSDSDTDNDGVKDYREILDGTNPNNASSFDSLSKGLVAYYPFDGNANDESGNWYNAQAPTQYEANRFGESLASLANASGSVSLPLSRFEDFTISFWYQKTVSTATGSLFQMRRLVGGYSFYNHLNVSLASSDGSTVSAGAGLTPSLSLQHSLSPRQGINGWNHAVVTLKDDPRYRLTLSVNGNKVAETNSFATFALGSSLMATFGKEELNIDDVRIYSRALSTSEIEKLYFVEAFSDENKEFLASRPTVMGHYSRTEYEDFGALQLSNGVSSVLTNPSAFNLFTQSEYESFGALEFSNGISSVISNPSTFNLFTPEEFNSNRIAGQSDVISNPMSYGLYTSDSIMDLRMGGLMIQRQGTNAVVSFQPQTTTDLTLPFTNNGTPITNTIPMPGHKGFIRINAKP